jgi:KUP system potassium uptake protein
MRADNEGEGGIMALMALAQRTLPKGSRSAYVVGILGIFGASLFFGDGVITPAITTLSAIEGLEIAAPQLDAWVVPLTIVVLVAVFASQRFGTAKVGRLFGPIMLVWFLALAVIGVHNITHAPEVFKAFSPWYAARFFLNHGTHGIFILGAVVLAVTGGEALYADMGHFGARPIRHAWYWFVLPALMLNYLGQGALVLEDPAAIQNPFYYMAPETLRLPLVILATAATFIASQAVISGAFSVTHQAVQLGFVPRLSILHTSDEHHGQIYIPLVNWVLMIAVILLVLLFQTSSNLASAYGIAVTGAMTIDTCLTGVLFIAVWKWKWWFAVPVTLLFFFVDGAYFTSNMTKVPEGGWFPLLVAAFAFTLLTTWAKGRRLMRERMAEVGLPLDIFAKSGRNSTAKVPGTAIFMNSGSSGTPSALLHNIKHNKVLHDRVVVLTVSIADVPYVDEIDRTEVTDMGDGFYRVMVRYGYMEETDVPAALKRLDNICSGPFEMMQTSFFLSRQTLLPSEKPGMALWREKLFAWMMRNAATPMEFFRLPTNRVVELGSQVEI